MVFLLCLLGFHSASARMSSVDAELVAALVQRVVALEQRVAELEQHVGVPQASRRARRPPLSGRCLGLPWGLSCLPCVYILEADSSAAAAAPALDADDADVPVAGAADIPEDIA